MAQAEVIQEWNFAEENWQGTEIHDQKSKLKGRSQVVPKFEDEALVLSEECFIEVPEITAGQLPDKALSVSTRVLIGGTRRWGSIVGFFQDNGGFERGWSLGYEEDRFVFWVSTGGRRISVHSNQSFQLGQWADITGVYDGQKIRLYVDGRLSAEADAPGKIVYPEDARFVIGAYVDKDEFYPMQGKLRKVTVRNSALTESEIRKTAGLPVPLKFSVRPSVRFIGSDKARVNWEIESASESWVEFGKTERFEDKAQASSDSGRFEVELTDLEPQTVYYYRVVDGDERSPIYELNTALNFTLPQVLRIEAWHPALQQSGIRRGYAIVFGANIELIRSLTNQSELVVVVFETDAKRVGEVRKILYEEQLYGSRVTVTQVESLTNLPVTSCMADFVFCDSNPPVEIEREVQRILVPGRGTAYAGRQVFATRPRTGESGEWTHQYGDAGNTASSQETLSGARSTSDLTVQWFGRPGADFGLDRNPRMPAPLSVNGRLYHQGMNRLVALNAANGAYLWSLEIPEFQRVNIPRDASNWCADADDLFVAVSEQAWVLDGETGERKAALKPAVNGGPYDWGYIARVGDRLLGSATKPKSAYKDHWSKRMWFDGKVGSFGTAQVCSDALFAYDSETLKPVWQYQGGTILNPTIAAIQNGVAFVESRHPSLRALDTNQISAPELWLDQYLVFLDLETGEVVWEHPIDTEDGLITFYLQATPEAILLTASNTAYHFYAFSPSTGLPMWSQSTSWPDDNHSGHIQHPVIVDGAVYLQPNGFDLLTGKLLTSEVGKRSGCHTYIGTKNALIYRGDGREVAMWDRESETVSTWPRLRPSCWLSLIPANGMLLVPEGGGGCSCGGWMETSIGFAPHQLLKGVTP